jgi:hypothetical protein
MASLLASLRVRLTAETSDFRAGMESARKQTRSFQKELNRFRRNSLAQVASLGAVTLALKSSLEVANRYDNAQRQLAATAKLTGVNFGFLQSTSKAAQDEFKLSAISANAFTIELTKLASKAGDVGKASAGLEAFLDIGAARGLSADQTLKAVQQSILGIDEGTDKLFSKNPSVLYAEYAAQIGTTAGKLTDQQKAQAVLNAAMQDGAKVRGEYQRWLTTSQGQQFLLTQSLEQTQAVLGRALQPALVAIIPLVSKFAEGIQWLVRETQVFGADLGLLAGYMRAAKKLFTDGPEAARQEIEIAREVWREMMDEIRNPADGPVAVPLDFNTSGTTAADAGRATALRYVEGIEAGLENLRHRADMTRFVTLSTPERLAKEEQHALRLLTIEEQHARARHRLGELTDAELGQTLEQINARRTLAQATRAQMEGAHSDAERITTEMERQDMLLSHQLDVERLAGQAALDRLGREASAAQRLATRLTTIERVFDIERQAILDNTRLTERQRDLELERLELARQRAEFEARSTAAQEARRAKEEKRRKAQEAAKTSAEKRADLRDQAIGAVGGMLAGALTGKAPSGSQMGSQIGSLAGQMIPLPGASILAPTIGGLIGGLFDREDEQEKPNHPVIKALTAIERAQRETITTISQQTDALLTPESRLLNLPTSFAVPRYNPGNSAGGATVIQGDTHVNVSLSFDVSGADAEEVKRLAMEGVEEALATGRRNSGWGRTNF